MTATSGTGQRTACEAIRRNAREINTLQGIFKLKRVRNKLLKNEEGITARRIKDIYLGKHKTEKSNKTLVKHLPIIIK